MGRAGGRAGEAIVAHGAESTPQDGRQGTAAFPSNARDAEWLKDGRAAAITSESQVTHAGLELPKLRLPPISSFIEGMSAIQQDAAAGGALICPASMADSMSAAATAASQQQAWQLLAQKAILRTEAPHLLSVSPPNAVAAAHLYPGALAGAAPALALAGVHTQGLHAGQVFPHISSRIYSPGLGAPCRALRCPIPVLDDAVCTSLVTGQIVSGLGYSLVPVLEEKPNLFSPARSRCTMHRQAFHSEYRIRQLQLHCIPARRSWRRRRLPSPSTMHTPRSPLRPARAAAPRPPPWHACRLHIPLFPKFRRAQ
jgi:hypothetical protein